MKHLKIMPAVLIVLLAMAMPSISAAQYHESRLDNFLRQHPGLREQLERNPNLIYNREFRHQHPDLQEFMQNHPNVWGKLPGYSRWGAYGPDRDWHEADWWHEHDPDWMYSNHPEWAENHPDWRSNDGDFDEHHEWHVRRWWNDHRPDWVEKHHPDWYRHEDHQAAREQGHQEKQQRQEANQPGNAQKHGHHKDDPNHHN